MYLWIRYKYTEIMPKLRKFHNNHWKNIYLYLKFVLKKCFFSAKKCFFLMILCFFSLFFLAKWLYDPCNLKNASGVMEFLLFSCYVVFTLSETENDFCSETDEMAKSTQCDWLLLAISSVSLQKSFSVSLSVKTPLTPP